MTLIMVYFLILLISNFQLIDCFLSCQYLVKTLPIPLKAHQMGYSSSLNKVFIFGGLTTGNTRSIAIYKWDTSEEDGWFNQIVGETTPHDVGNNFFSHHSSVVTINNRVYFVGMFDSWTPTKWAHIHIFDMLSESFIDNSNILQAPYPSYGGCVATNNTHIFMVGGRLDGNDFLNYIQIYCINDNTWYAEEITTNRINQGWGYQFCEMINNELYVFGGSIGYPSDETDRYYKYTWDIEQAQSKWTYLGQKSMASTAGTSSYYPDNNNIYLIGGGGWPYYDTIDVFNTESKTITNTYNMIDAYSGLSSIIIGDILYIFGGWDSVYDAISSKVEVCHLKPLKIRNCAGASSTSYTAEVLGVPNDFQLKHVKMRDADNGNVWLDAIDNYDENTGCYVWTMGNTPYQLPFDFKLKANKDGTGVVIRGWQIIDSFDDGDKGDMGRNFIVGIETDNVNTQDASSFISPFISPFVTPLWMILLIIITCIVIFINIVIFIKYFITKRKTNDESYDTDKESEKVVMIQ